MADGFDRPLRDEDPVDWDETVEDLPIGEASPDAPPPWGDDHELRKAALSQRFVGAALRARRDTTAEREARVAGILDALPEEPGKRGGLVAFGPWLSAAAAAALLALLVWSVLNQESGRSELEAAVLESAVKGLVHDDVDRLFEVDVSLRDDATGVFERIGTHQLFTRCGGWFRLEFDGVLAEDMIVLCDSQKMWVRPPRETKYKEIPDLANLRAAIGGPLRDGGFFDSGYLRLSSVVDQLAGSGHLRYSRVVADEGAAGRVRYLFAASRGCETPFGEVHDVAILVDDDFDEVDSLEFRLVGPYLGHEFRLSFRHRGTVERDDARFRPPPE